MTLQDRADRDDLDSVPIHDDGVSESAANDVQNSADVLILDNEEFPAQFWMSITVDQAIDNLLLPSCRTTRIEIDDAQDTFRETDDIDAVLDPKSSTAMTRKLNLKKDQIFGSSSSIPFLPGGFVAKSNPSSLISHQPPIDLDSLFSCLDADHDLDETRLLSLAQPVLDIHPDPERRDLIASICSQAADKSESETTSVPIVSNTPNLLTAHNHRNSDREAQLLHDAIRRKEEMKAMRLAVEKEVGIMLSTQQQQQEQRPQQHEERSVLSMASIFGSGRDDDNHSLDLLPPAQAQEQIQQSIVQESAGPEPVSALVVAGEDVDQLLPVDSGSVQTQERFAFEEKLKPKHDINFKEIIKEMAIEYPFELDSFQQQAILHLEKGESVFVAAHTSAGKTVVAEYAIALCTKHMTKAIYTSPIKTLSNQKFREFKKTFGEVGLITGDVQINPDASCLIVTTEILRSMLYKGADVIRDIEWCVFDEVHYLNDPERGVVWEEVIIMLPAHVNVILLSATVPNPLEFAEWVGRTKRKPIYVISTSQRPVPLQHYLWCNNTMYNIVDAESNFVSNGFKLAQDELSKKAKMQIRTGGGGGGGQKKATPQTGNWVALLKQLKNNKQLPVVVFSFSKKTCEMAAGGLISQDLTVASEKSEIHLLCESSLKRLPECDRALPQIIRVQGMLSRGIGVHHSGLLPVVKELVEMAFAKGVVKILFATETFAMGVNMPTRTVVFNGLRKHDGSEFRDLRPGEYTQMAGRAGRRGLDPFGNVVINCADGRIPDQQTVKNMILGEPTALQSKFRLTFSMILNLLRVEELQVEDMIKRSFSEFNTQQNEPRNMAQISKDEISLKALPPIDCIYGDPQLIANYYDLYEKREICHSEIMRWIIQSPSCDHYLKPGRVMIVSIHNLIKALGIVISSQRTPRGRSIQVFVLCPQRWTPTSLMRKTAASSASSLSWGTSRTGIPYLITPIRPSNVNLICSETIRVDEREILVEERADDIQRALDQLQMIDISNVHELHPTRDMKIKEMDFVLMVKDLENLPPLDSSQCHTCPKHDEHFAQIKEAKNIAHRLDRLRFLVSDSNVELIANMKERIAVLQRLNYVDDDRALLLKGRVACEINTCDCLIVSELIFENVFSSVEPHEAAALLSCLVFQGKTDDAPKLNDRMLELKQRLVEIATGLGVLQLECGMDLTAKSYIDENCNFGLIEVVYEWAQGTSFAKICDITTVDEGLIVRCIVRLVEVCRDVRNAARVIGDPKLFQLMDRAATAIRRDIVFAASLYVT